VTRAVPAAVRAALRVSFPMALPSSVPSAAPTAVQTARPHRFRRRAAPRIVAHDHAPRARRGNSISHHHLVT